MELSRNTVPGVGVVHQFTTDEGHQLGLVVQQGKRHLVVYDADHPDSPLRTVVLTQEEADRLAELLHSRPIAERVAELERRLGVTVR